MSDLNEEAYSLNMFTEYIEELQSYDVVLDYIQAAALSVRRLETFSCYCVSSRILSKFSLVMCHFEYRCCFGVAITK